MAGMTLQQMRDYVRNTLELDSTEVADALLDAWIQEGYNHIVARPDRPWKGFECNWTLTTQAGVQDYGRSDTNAFIQPFRFSGQLAGVKTFQYVYLAGYGLLEKQPHDWLAAAFLNVSNGKPIYYSDHNDRLSLWPTPDAIYTLAIEGQRLPVDWMATGAGTQPDLPAEFHPLIARWALGLAYAQQDQPDMTVLHHTAVERMLQPMLKFWDTNTASEPLVLNRGIPSGSRLRPYMGRPRFSFE